MYIGQQLVCAWGVWMGVGIAMTITILALALAIIGAGMWGEWVSLEK